VTVVSLVQGRVVVKVGYLDSSRAALMVERKVVQKVLYWDFLSVV